MDACLYVGPNLGSTAVVSHPELAETTERHKIRLNVPPLAVDLTPLATLDARPDLLGAIIGMERGYPGWSHLRFAARVAQRRRRVWLYWPDESAIECLDPERVRSYWRHWIFITSVRLKRRLTIMLKLRKPDPAPELAERCSRALRQVIDDPRPVQLPLATRPSPTEPVKGLGVYLRTDYWVAITSGGSYGHTCYVAKELAATTERFVCLMANRYPLLDTYGLRQVVIPPASDESHEIALLQSTWHHYSHLRVALEALQPAYVYERLVLGNFVGALLTRELGIPYILEYNGSEISMSRSFDGVSYRWQEIFVQAEDAAFRQATIIVVVSQVLKDSLIARGVDPDKILVNPNGADPTVYSPPPPDVRRAIRTEQGFTDEDRVIGFSATFGGWHGVDVLAEAIPQICARDPKARFLLIGDGTHKPLLDQAVAAHSLGPRVRSVGRVPQSEGARLLRACDLFLSPHSSNMFDSKFFGSPTKLFEYMATGAGIVSSDLEQLGEVLSPALRVGDLASPALSVGRERAVLCKPADVGEFVDAVVALADRPDVADALGRNARQAVIDSYSWAGNVQRVWRFLCERRQSADREQVQGIQRVETGDAYKQQVQNQWNTNPVGPQYAKKHVPHTLDWFVEIEGHRYSSYAPWMPDLMEFESHAGEDVLEIGGGVGTDLSRFARSGARVTDLDLSAGHLEHARENFALRGLSGRFVHQDAEQLPFDADSFDVVYSNGVLHHTPNTRQVVQEICRVLRPGGRVIAMTYAENSWHYWARLMMEYGIDRELLRWYSMGEIMSRYVEITRNDARPLVKVYTAKRLISLFPGFDNRRVFKRQLTAAELPASLQWLPLDLAGRLMGWNLIIKAEKPRHA